MSGIPSPVIADVGTSETVLAKFVFSSKISALRPCSAKASLVFLTLSSNSERTDFGCWARLSRNPPFGVAFQPYIRSI